MESRPRSLKVQHVTIAQVLLRYLALEGVEYLFGLPGGALAHILDELKNQRDRFQYIICRHETGAAYMADGYFRATGKLGVVMVTSGPGATNALTGAMNAQSGSSALLTISGEVDEQFFGLGYLQDGTDANLDVTALYTAATQYSALVTEQDNFPTLLAQALRDTLSIPRRAAHLSIPNDIAGRVLAELELPARPSSYRAVPSSAPEEQVAQAFDLLLAARRPLLFLGNGCRAALRGPALAQLLALVDKHGIPVMTTADAKGIFPESHPLSLRVYGFASCMWPQYYLRPERLGGAGEPPFDALLVLGSSLDGHSTNLWNSMLVPQGPMIQLDINPAVIARAFHVDLGIVGEVGTAIGQLARLSEARQPDVAAVRARKELVARIRRAHAPFQHPEQYAAETAPIRPAALVRVVQEALPPGAFIALDSGNCVGWGIHCFTVDPPTEIHSALSMGPMGFAVGAVIGAKLGCPERTCVALVGDGAFLMHGTEVSTARQYGIGAIWIVLYDDDLNMVSQGQAHFFPDAGKPEIWTQLYRLGAPDLARFAAGLGADAHEIRSPEELRRALALALPRANQEQRPQVIIAHIERSATPPYYNPDYIDKTHPVWRKRFRKQR